MYWCNNLIWWLLELCRVRSCLQLQTSKDKRFINSCTLACKRNINNNFNGRSFSYIKKWLYCFHCCWSAFKLHLDTCSGNALSASLERLYGIDFLYLRFCAAVALLNQQAISTPCRTSDQRMLIHFHIHFEWEMFNVTFTYSLQISNLICLFVVQSVAQCDLLQFASSSLD